MTTTVTTATPDIAAPDLEESRLARERDELLEAARLKPTGVNLKSLKKADNALKGYRASLAAANGQTFGNLMDVLTFLSPEWSINKSTLYEHKNAGKIRKNPAGTYSLIAVEEYARQHLQRKTGGGADELGNLQGQKLNAEIRRISSDAEMRELRLQERRGELIPREYVEIELAARAGDLKTHLDASARSSASRIIKLVAGDHGLAPDLISFLLGVNSKVLDNYSRPIAGPDEEDDA